jgi:tRNA uridine 5-carboxymethylaminomethyl modification enzyme
MEEQKGDDNIVGFSFAPVQKIRPEAQLSCHISYTNSTVHEILKTGFDRSPMYQGRIDGVGPRYCPSIEDKINRFADRDRHQLFVEPEGWNTVEIYVNGFSTSLPEEVQYEALRMVPGFESVRLFRPGYAIEYDYFPPTQLKYSLETRLIKGLFFAGQINGTTGYEEAACQGLMAGINAHLYVREEAPLILSRNEAYIGVLIDDLISKGTDEPYRMFTSRAEFRTLLRQDNADWRLTEKSYQLGLAEEARMRSLEKKKNEVAFITETCSNDSLDPSTINPYLDSLSSAPISEKQKLGKILLRPGVSLPGILENTPELKEKLSTIPPESIEQAEIQIKYARYIEKEEEMAQKLSQLDNLAIPGHLDYDRIPALSNEATQKFKKIRPATLGQASRISGVNPSDVQILLVYMGR